MNLFVVGAVLAALGAIAIGVLGARAPHLRPWGVALTGLGGLMLVIQAAQGTPLVVDGAFSSANVGVWIAAFLTLAIFSFLYQDNPFYKFAEHLFVGVGSGYYITVYFWNTLLPNLFAQISEGSRMVGDGNWSGAFLGEEPGLRMLIPLALGVFIMLLFIAPKYGWLSRISFAWYIGVASGFSIPTVIVTRVLMQGQGAVREFCVYSERCAAGAGLTAVEPTGGMWLNAVILLVGTLAALAYFFFSLPSRGPVKVLNRTGILFLMISFGASFGYTVMARISLLIGRFQFLLEDWMGMTVG